MFQGLSTVIYQEEEHGKAILADEIRTDCIFDR
jgi:hypothetical protein